MLDLSIKADGPLTANAEAAAEEIPSFVSLVNAAIEAAPKEGLQEANTVIVQPGGKTFPTITAALNSITDAKLQKQYVVQIGPGTYNEVVVCKPYVYLSGAGVEHTTITAPASANQWDKGTVKAASNSAVQDMTILSVGTAWGSWATAVDCTAAVNFDIENCNLEANASGDGPNLVTLAVDYNSAGGGSQINVAYTMVGAHGGAQPIGMLVYARAFVNVTDSKIVADTGNVAWGASASNGSAIKLFGTTVLGTTMSLVLSDSSSQITATNCKLIGPYSPGVVVNPSSD